MKISIYTSAFNLLKNKFDYEDALSNFLKFGDEVIVAVNTSEDDTLFELNQFSLNYPNRLVIVTTDFSYEDPLLDGKVKNAALQECGYEICIGVDMDERLPLWQKNTWYRLAQELKESYFDSYFIPSINLYEDKYHYFSITKKWYMHKRKGLFRGPVNFGRNTDGTVDVNKSDTCELIDSNGNLAVSMNVSLADAYVFHLGYMNLDDKVLRNKNFWAKHWSVEAGKTVQIPLDIEEIKLDKIKKKHNFRLWYDY